MMMAGAMRRMGPGPDLARWFGGRLDDRWWEELWPERFMAAFGRGFVPVEEFRDGDVMVVRAELPGIDPDKDVEISVHDGMLTIKGERSEEQKEEGKKSFYRSEFRYGMFERTVPLPAGVTEKDVTASYQDGVLEVRVPMPAKEKTKAKIRVQRPE